MLPGGALNLRELEALARERLSTMAYDYYASGAQDEHTLRENIDAWSRIAVHYRVLVDVTRRDTTTRELDQAMALAGCARVADATRELVA